MKNKNTISKRKYGLAVLNELNKLEEK